ncbi:hypothetical protein SDC9_127316 [bioreactor metagenome]|uniref:Uncharacterized protein n=1 Tax=bioreactor metagenome TaxID=1076179 RepID=A0A645CTP4_9ZZZZ
MEFKKILQILKIAVHKDKALIGNDIIESIFILIKSQQLTLFPKFPENLSRMPTTTKRTVHINPIRTDIQPINGFSEQRRYMIKSFIHGVRYLFFHHSFFQQGSKIRSR